MEQPVEFILLGGRHYTLSSKPFDENLLKLQSMWNTLVDTASESTFYHSLPWLRALQSIGGQKIKIYMVAREGICSVGTVLAHRNIIGFRIGSKPWATFYNGTIHVNQVPQADKDLLRQRLQTDFHAFRLVSNSPKEDPHTIHSLPKQLRAQSTAVLSISDLQSLYHSLDRRVRQRIRKASTLGITIQSVSNFEIFYDLYSMTYRRQGLDMPIRREQMVGFLAAASKSDNFKVFQANTSQGDPAAVLAVGSDKKRPYFVLAASHPNLRKTDAVTHLWWEVIQQYAKRYEEIDLVGMGMPGIARFKRSFMPRIVEVSDVTYYSSWSTRAIIESAKWLKVQYRTRFRSIR